MRLLLGQRERILQLAKLYSFMQQPPFKMKGHHLLKGAAQPLDSARELDSWVWHVREAREQSHRADARLAESLREARELQGELQLSKIGFVRLRTEAEQASRERGRWEGQLEASRSCIRKLEARLSGLCQVRAHRPRPVREQAGALGPAREVEELEAQRERLLRERFALDRIDQEQEREVRALARELNIVPVAPAASSCGLVSPRTVSEAVDVLTGDIEATAADAEAVRLELEAMGISEVDWRVCHVALLDESRRCGVRRRPPGRSLWRFSRSAPKAPRPCEHSSSRVRKPHALCENLSRHWRRHRNALQLWMLSAARGRPSEKRGSALCGESSRHSTLHELRAEQGKRHVRWRQLSWRLVAHGSSSRWKLKKLQPCSLKLPWRRLHKALNHAAVSSAPSEVKSSGSALRLLTVSSVKSSCAESLRRSAIERRKPAVWQQSCWSGGAMSLSKPTRLCAGATERLPVPAPLRGRCASARSSRWPPQSGRVGSHVSCWAPALMPYTAVWQKLKARTHVRCWSCRRNCASSGGTRRSSSGRRRCGGMTDQKSSRGKGV
mmetsp:Transcript_26390/g.61552  ORF Transcript_26390/g.61552 Transcript_26390/m.61552 type:complete len:555 (+) Transcript_26390:59-1723(+)